VNASDPFISEHLEHSIQAIAKLHADHDRAATRSEHVLAGIVDLLGRPLFLAVLLATIVGWTGANLWVRATGGASIDPPPFAWLELAASLGALGITVLILATQRRDDQLGQHRDQMTLQLALLSEQKLAKIIELIEENRRDNPLLGDRVDPTAHAMAMPTDPQSLGDAIKSMDRGIRPAAGIQGPSKSNGKGSG
jgi:uncharacterized membrane protein